MSHVVFVHVPAYENLSLEQIFSHMAGHENVFQYLPDGKEMRKLPKQWIVNIIATIAGESFISWVSQRIKERNLAVVKEKNLGIQMD